VGFQCEGCACGLDVGDGARDLDACRRRFAADVFRAFAGPLLERQGHTLQAVQQAMCPCGGAEVSCGDAMVALPTLIHRGPGNTSDTQTRDVLYFTLQPIGFPSLRRSVPAPLAPDDDSQVSALWLLLLGRRALSTNLQGPLFSTAETAPAPFSETSGLSLQRACFARFRGVITSGGFMEDGRRKRTVFRAKAILGYTQATQNRHELKQCSNITAR